MRNGEHRVFFMDVLFVQYAQGGLIPINCKLQPVRTKNGTKNEAYNAGLAYLEENGMLVDDWRLNAYDHPDMLDGLYREMQTKCRLNRQRIWLMGQ